MSDELNELEHRTFYKVEHCFWGAACWLPFWVLSVFPIPAVAVGLLSFVLLCLGLGLVAVSVVVTCLVRKSTWPFIGCALVPISLFTVEAIARPILGSFAESAVMQMKNAATDLDLPALHRELPVIFDAHKHCSSVCQSIALRGYKVFLPARPDDIRQKKVRSGSVGQRFEGTFVRRGSGAECENDRLRLSQIQLIKKGYVGVCLIKSKGDAPRKALHLIAKSYGFKNYEHERKYAYLNSYIGSFLALLHIDGSREKIIKHFVCGYAQKKGFVVQSKKSIRVVTLPMKYRISQSHYHTCDRDLGERLWSEVFGFEMDQSTRISAIEKMRAYEHLLFRKRVKNGKHYAVTDANTLHPYKLLVRDMLDLKHGPTARAEALKSIQFILQQPSLDDQSSRTFRDLLERSAER